MLWVCACYIVYICDFEWFHISHPTVLPCTGANNWVSASKVGLQECNLLLFLLICTNWLTVEQTREAINKLYFVGTLNCTAARTEIVVLRPIPNSFEQIVKKCEAVRTASAGALNATTQMEEVLPMYVATWSTSELQIWKKCENLVDFTGNRNAYNQSSMVSNDTVGSFGTFTYLDKRFEHKRDPIHPLQLLYTAAILQFDVGILNGIHEGKVSQKTLTNAQMLKKWKIPRKLTTQTSYSTFKQRKNIQGSRLMKILAGNFQSSVSSHFNFLESIGEPAQGQEYDWSFTHCFVVYRKKKVFSYYKCTREVYCSEQCSTNSCCHVRLEMVTKLSHQVKKKCKNVNVGFLNGTIASPFAKILRAKLHWQTELKSLKKCEGIISPVSTVKIITMLDSVLDAGHQAWTFSRSVCLVVTLTSQGRAQCSKRCKQ